MEMSASSDASLDRFAAEFNFRLLSLHLERAMAEGVPGREALRNLLREIFVEEPCAPEDRASLKILAQILQEKCRINVAKVIAEGWPSDSTGNA